MARTTKQLSGAGKDKFLRGVVAGELGIASDVADRLGSTLCSAIADVRVRRDVWSMSKDVASSEPSPSKAVAPSPEMPEFDPFGFSAMAVLSRHGQIGLEEKLKTIASSKNLLALAKAQHLGVDPACTEPDALRAAIVEATKTRLAERRAAAS